MRVIRERTSSRLRAALRGSLPAIVTLAALLAGLATLATLFESLGTTSVVGAVLALAAQLCLYLALIAAAVWMGAKLERSDYGAFGLNVDADWVRNFAAGVTITLLGIGISLAYGEFRGLRDVDFSAIGANGSGDPLAFGVVVAVYVVYFLFGNVYEEVVYRRIAIRNFASGLAGRGFSPVAAIVSATAGSLLLFGAYHVPLRGNVVVAVDAAMVGVTFALAYIITGDLSLPVGIHFGRLPTVFMSGVTMAGFDVSPVVAITRDTLAANLEVKLLRLTVICLGVLAWTYWARGEIRVADVVLRQTDTPAERA